MKFFTTSHSSLEEVFASDTTYRIPAYQRPYSWQSLGKTDHNNQINRMWEDLFAFFTEEQREKEYFFGSMVVIQAESRTFDVVDGQQRLTTLSLLFAAMSCFLRERCQDPKLQAFKERATATLEKLLYNYSGIDLVPSLKVKIQRTSGYDYNGVLERATRCDPSSGVDDPRYEEIARRYFDNRDYFRARLSESFLTNGEFTRDDAERFNHFYTFLNTRVVIVRITTTSFETAYTIFETLNNRGLPLTNRDLLRNFILKELDEAGDPDAASKWTTLEQDNALTEDFIGRWVESRRGRQQQASAFNDLIEMYGERGAFEPPLGKHKIHVFYDQLSIDLRRYSLIAEPRARVESAAIRNKIRFFRVSGNARYSANLMLALFSCLDYEGGESEVVLDFLCAYQRWLLYIALLPGARFSSVIVYRAINALKAGRLADAKAAFALGDEGRARLLDYIDGELRDNWVATRLLAEYVWHEEAAARDVVSQELRWDDASLEHIIPQNPSQSSAWVRDFPEDFRKKYTYRLGNMTLLTTKMNSAAKNYDFDKKRLLYKKTLLPITRELCQREALDPATIEARHRAIVSGVLAGLRLRRDGE